MHWFKWKEKILSGQLNWNKMWRGALIVIAVFANIKVQTCTATENESLKVTKWNVKWIWTCLVSTLCIYFIDIPNSLSASVKNSQSWWKLTCGTNRPPSKVLNCTFDLFSFPFLPSFPTHSEKEVCRVVLYKSLFFRGTRTPQRAQDKLHCVSFVGKGEESRSWRRFKTLFKWVSFSNVYFCFWRLRYRISSNS